MTALDTRTDTAPPRRSSTTNLVVLLIVLLLASPFAAVLLGLSVRLFRLVAGV